MGARVSAEPVRRAQVTVGEMETIMVVGSGLTDRVCRA